MRQFFVYILASRNSVLYVGVTNDLERRIHQHRQKLLPGFTATYNASLLVHYEVFTDIREAIAREKQIKSWRREKKIRLVEAENPTWRDLAEVEAEAASQSGPPPQPEIPRVATAPLGMTGRAVPR